MGAQASEPEFVLELADEMLGDSVQFSKLGKNITVTPEQQEAKEVVQGMLTKLFNEDAVKKIADKDTNGITIDEARNYLISIAGEDGDGETLSLTDIRKALDELGINPEDILNEKVKEILAEQ